MMGAWAWDQGALGFTGAWPWDYSVPGTEVPVGPRCPGHAITAVDTAVDTAADTVAPSPQYSPVLPAFGHRYPPCLPAQGPGAAH